MRKLEAIQRFGPEIWAVMRATGEHVKVECWSGPHAFYRVRSRKNGLQFATEAELDEVGGHPEAHLGRSWPRCKVPGCGAPLTAELTTCLACHAPTCTCGRCECRGVKKKRASAAQKSLVAEPATS